MFLLVKLAFSLVADLLYALLLKWLFSTIGIPFLADLSYWQDFGLLVVGGIFYYSATLFDSLEDL